MIKFVVATAILAVVSAEAPGGSYGVPGAAIGLRSSALSNQYGLPPSGPPSNAYGIPQASSASGPSNSYGAPQGSSFGAQSLQAQALPGNNYGAPSQRSLPGNNYGAPGSLGIPSSAYGSPGGRNSGINDGPIESEPNLELENEGADLPSDIVGQELLDRVVDAISQDLAQQEAARAASAAAQRSAYGAPAYGPPSGQYGAPGSGIGGLSGLSGLQNGGRIMLLIPPDPLKARLIANYIQRGSRPLTDDDINKYSRNNQGGYNSGNDLGYSAPGSGRGY